MEKIIRNRVKINLFLLYGFVGYSLVMFIFPNEIRMVNNAFYLLVLLSSLVLTFAYNSNELIGFYRKNKWFLQSFGALAVVSLFSLLVGEGAGDTSILKLLKHVLYLLAFYCLLNILYEHQRKLVIWVFICTVLASLMAGYFTLFKSGFSYDIHRFRSVSAIGSVPVLADILGCCALYLFLTYVREKKYYIAFVVFVIATFLIAFLQGRAVIFALLVVSLFWFFYEPIPRKAKLMLVLLVFCLLVFSMALLYLIVGGEILDEMMGRYNPRLEMWGILIDKVRSCSLLIGCGYDAESSMTYSINEVRYFQPYYHNIFLSSLFYTGMAGMLALFVFVIIALYQSFRVYSVWGYVLSLALICLMFEGDKVFSNPNYTWYLFWFPLIFCYLDGKKLKADS